MKIILLKNIEKLGKVGEIKDVSAGFASNYLIPNKMAKPATDNVLKEVEKQVESQKIKEKIVSIKTRKLIEKIKRQELEIEQKAKNGKLFGSVKQKDIVALINQKGFKIEEKNVIFQKTIKEVGVFDIEIKLQNGISTIIKLTVKEK